MLAVAAWVLFSIAAATFVVETAFMQYASARRVMALGVAMPLDVRLVCYFWLVVGVPADVAFNLTRGTIMFRELPHELLFTSRVKRHVRESSGRDYERARLWADFLNAADPGHIREVKPE